MNRSGIDRLQLLADASRMLAETSLEYTATLEALAKIVVPRLADDCVVFMIDDGNIARVTEASVSDDNAAVLRKLREHPPTLGGSNAVVSSVRSGKTVFVEQVDDHVLANLAGSTEHAAALRAVHPRTFITVPLFGRGHVVGAFTFGMSVSARRYSQDDVQLAEEIGRRAGMALENARLFRDAIDAQRRAETAEQRMGRLQAMTIVFSRVMSPNEVGEAVVEQGLGLFGAQSGHVYLCRDNELLVIASRGAEPGAIPHVDKPLYEADRVVLPLAVDGTALGAIALQLPAPRTFLPEERQLAEAMTSQAALALARSLVARDLQQAIQVRDDFLATAGHELKTPLAALLMHVDSMHRQVAKNIIPTNLYQRLDKASKAGTRLERLIDELLDVSRITAGRLVLEPEPVQLDELVRDVVDRFADQATSAGCTIVLTATPIAGTWDRARIDQVVSNLVANALKYGRGKPVEISVGEHADRAVLRVVDHGIGVAADEQAKIFERFERAVQNREFGGFGLGLWIARQIVETSGGSIEVSSAPDQGATFTVTLPTQGRMP